MQHAFRAWFLLFCFWSYAPVCVIYSRVEFISSILFSIIINFLLKCFCCLVPWLSQRGWELLSTNQKFEIAWIRHASVAIVNWSWAHFPAIDFHGFSFHFIFLFLFVPVQEKPMRSNINTIGFLRSSAISISLSLSSRLLFSNYSNSYQKKSKRNVILICHDGTVSRMQSIERSTSNATKFTGIREIETVFGSYSFPVCAQFFFVSWFSNSRIVECKRTIRFVYFVKLDTVK